MLGLAFGGQFFGRFQALLFEVSDFACVGFDDAGIRGIDDAVEQLLDLFFDVSHFLLQRLADLSRLDGALPPGIDKHVASDGEQAFGGLHAMQQSLEVAFELITPNGFAVAAASLGEAKIIGMFGAGLAG